MEKVELAFAIVMSVFYGFVGIAIFLGFKNIIKSRSGQATHKRYPKRPKDCKLHKWEFEHDWLICQECGFISGSEDYL